MQTFENLLQNYLTVFLDIAHKYSLGMCKRQFELTANLLNKTT